MDCCLEVNTYSKLQVYIFSNDRDITKCQCCCRTMTDDDNNDAKAIIAIPWVFFKNSRAKNAGYQHFSCCIQHPPNFIVNVQYRAKIE